MFGSLSGEIEKATKPRPFAGCDVSAECVTEEYDDKGGGAFCISVDNGSIYTAKEARRLIRFLLRAEKWLEAKEYRLHGIKPRSTNGN
jgi:hypothetical protein